MDKFRKDRRIRRNEPSGRYRIGAAAAVVSAIVALNFRAASISGVKESSETPPAMSSAKMTYSTPDYVYPADSGYYDVKRSPFNCHGDGVHDDTTCILSAVQAALATRNKHGYGVHGATVYFPAGTYLVSDTIRWASYGNNDAVVSANVDARRGCISSFNIVKAGSGYDPAPWGWHGESNPGPGLYLSGGGGSGAEFYATRNNRGAVTSVLTSLGNLEIGNCAGGHGYRSAPTVTVLNWRAYLRLEGQNKANTTIKLAPNSKAFQNSDCNISPHGDSDAREYCRPMIMTASERSAGSTGFGEDAYENDLWNLTIDTGSGNPGAIAVDWVGSNRASIKNVNVISEDQRGRCGLSVSRSASAGTGPAYVKNVSISGFDYGIYANEAATEVGNTFEYIDLSHIKIAGVVNKNMPNWFRQVSADIAAPVFETNGTGSLLVVNGRFISGASNLTAVRAPSTSTGGVVYLRNIKTDGYQAVLAVGAAYTVLPGSNISEYAYPAAVSSFLSSPVSLDLPDIPNTPEYVDGNLADWASAGRYCARVGGDKTSCIQAAMNSGKPVVYFPFNGDYWTSATIHVPSTVRVIDGMNSTLSSSMGPGTQPNTDGNHRAEYCTIEFDGEGPNNIELRNFSFDISTQSRTFCYNGSAPLVIADVLNGVGISNTPKGSGTIYLENVAVPQGNYTLAASQHVYARQYDVETSGDNVTVTGGTWWMFGFKSEGSRPGSLWNITNSTFELLGCFSSNHGASSPGPAFLFKNSRYSLAAVTTYSNGWANAVLDTAGNKTTGAPVNGQWLNGIGYGLYRGR